MIVSELKEIKSIKLGNVDIQKVYSGDDKVFEKGDEWFYVCHSSTGIIERLKVGTIDWPSLVSSGTKYGGLYKDWAGKGDYAKLIENGQVDTLEFIDNKLQDVNYAAYNGDTLKSTNRFQKTNAYDSIQFPVKNSIYYISECREQYFTTYIELAYTGTTIDNIFIISPIDTNLYGKTLMICKNLQTQEEIEDNPSIVSNITAPRNGTNVTIKAQNLDTNILRGYLIEEDRTLEPNKYYSFKFKYSTLDKYTFYTPDIYVYTGNITTDTIIIQTTPFNI